MSTPPGSAVLARTSLMRQINWKTTQQGASRNEGHHQRRTGKTILTRTRLTESMSGPRTIFECMFDIDVLAAVDPHADESALIEQIGWLERVKSAASAGQARASAALDEKRRAAEAAAGVAKAKQGRGLASEVALARRDSPARGGRHLGLAKALVHEMPHTLAALERGALSEWRATLIARESACLDVEDRRRLDAELCANIGKLEGMGDARIVAAAKEIAAGLHDLRNRAVAGRPGGGCVCGAEQEYLVDAL